MAKGTFAECPKCGAKVRKDRLQRHLSTVHEKSEKPSIGPTRKAAPARTVSFPWVTFVAVAVVATVVLAGYWVLTRVPGGGSPPPGGLPVAVMETNFGTIRIELDTVRAPRTAGNFINLAKARFYDGLTFHRLAKDFVIQGGDPNGDGSGGSGSSVPWESTGLRNTLHTIAMARSGDPNSAAGKDTATSQFFLNLKDNPALDSYVYPFVVFGTVIGGRDVVTALGNLYPAGQATYDGPPTQRVTIIRVTIVE